MASEPLDSTPALNAAPSMDPVRRGSLPLSVSPWNSPITKPTWRASSGVTSTFPRPRMPDEPKRGTIKHIQSPDQASAKPAAQDNNYIATLIYILMHHHAPQS